MEDTNHHISQSALRLGVYRLVKLFLVQVETNKIGHMIYLDSSSSTKVTLGILSTSLKLKIELSLMSEE